jgi:hypothetical protein
MPSQYRLAVIGCIAALGAFVEPIESAETETIVLQDEMRTAFYEHAPANLASSMARAVRSNCANPQQGSTVPAWLCSRPHLRYLIDVYLNGAKGTHGLVCDDGGTFELKYFGVDLVADLISDHTCLNLEYDGKAFHVLAVQARSGGASLVPGAVN